MADHACAAPGRVALACDADRITWGNLDVAVGRLAKWLAATVPAGGAVALHLPNGPPLALLFLAAARAGREAQVLDPQWPIETTRRLLGELRPCKLVTLDRELAAGDSIVLASGSVPFAEVADALGAPSHAGRLPEPDPNLPFYVGFTSGSTGMPKGFRRSSRSWEASFRADATEFAIAPDDIVLAPGSLTHSLFLYALANGLHAGATVVFCRRLQPHSALRLLREHEATVLYGVPTQLALLADAAAQDGSEFPHMRLVLSSGAKWFGADTPRLRRAFPAAEFAEFYGASELSFVTVRKDGEPVPPGSVGRPFSGVTVTIRDGSGGRVPSGGSGYVFAESPYLFSGYACGDSGDLLRAGEAISVGDIGYLDENGALYLTGRANRMIVSSGKNVYPEEIEAVLERHPGVETAAVLAEPDARRGERLVGLVRVRGGAPVTRSDLVAHARSRLPLYKVPRVYAGVTEWPLLPSGKTDLQALGRIWREGACRRIL